MPSLKRSIFLALYLLILLLLLSSNGPAAAEEEPPRIRPWAENPFYWEYQGGPVLLVGGSDDDNLFQWPDRELKIQLDHLQSIGGNYIRNTMSDRKDKGFEEYPFLKLDDGRYDLNQFNPEYWRRFERLLEWTAARDIIVQIEIWDRFDYSREHWPPHPYNPVNNVNYTYQKSGFQPEYPEHPGKNLQPFFFTTPGQRNNSIVFQYQIRFVDRLLSHSLKYGNVLYCMDNETQAEEEWGRYWATHVRERARQQGVAVSVTEMWDPHNIRHDLHRHTLDHPGLYDFVDVSQNNHQSRHIHWENALWVRNYVKKHPRPVNSVKIYGADDNKFGHTDQDGLERFWRHLLAGFASVRFHRPPSGLGLNSKAQSAIGMARRLEEHAPLWRLAPRQDLLTENHPNEAYLAADPEKTYVVYFTDGGKVGVLLPAGSYGLQWLGLSMSETGSDSDQVSAPVKVESGGRLSLEAPGGGHWIAVLNRD